MTGLCAAPALTVDNSSSTASTGEKDFHMKIKAGMALFGTDAIVTKIKENTNAFYGATRYQANSSALAKIN